MVHKSTDITITVKSNFTETPGYRSIVFERPAGFDYESGDWIDLQFSDPHLSGGPTYSLSSSPTEPDLMITFKDGLSGIKRALVALQPGDTVKIFQYGNDYKFTLKPHQSSTLIAGGVGVAPFRSMLAEMAATSETNEVKLIYMNKDQDFLFRDELESWQGLLSNLSIEYIVTGLLNRKARTQALLDAIGAMEQSFYIAGPEGMVEATEHLLIDNGVKLGDIKIDIFGGL
ncbi:MAG: hypothetical protein NVSMB39_5200 [Candidatus Saccharimonadales bacterium]